MGNTHKLYISCFGPMGLFEEAKALKDDEQNGRSVGYESSIMMTMLQKALLSHPLTGLKKTRQNIYLFTRKLEAGHFPACQ